MRILRHRHATILGTLAACVLAMPASAAARCVGSDLRPAGSNLDTIRSATLCLVNGERAAAGLGALTENPRLTEASNAYAQEMVNRRFFAHVDPDGSTLSQRLFNYGYLLDSAPNWLAGENIAWAERSLSTPGQVVAAWMQSPGHRENILEPRFREVGLGVALGSPEGDAPDQAATYTTDFGMIDAPPADQMAEEHQTVGTTVATSKTASTATSARRARAVRKALKACRKATKASKAAKGRVAKRKAARRAAKLCARARARARR